MKSVFYITALTFLFSLNGYSQEGNPAGMLPEKFTREIIQRLCKSNLDSKNKLQTESSSITFGKKLFGNGFLLTKRIYKVWTGSAWGGGAKSFYKYDANNNLIELLTEAWYYFNYTNSSKVSYIYDEKNNLIESLLQTWDGSAWVNYEKYSYTYDENKNLTTKLYRIWVDDSWDNRGQKYSYQYDGNNNLIEELFQIWENYDWVNFQKDLYTYDGGNKEIGYLQLHWDGSTWVNNMKLLSYKYDEHNNLIENLWRYWNGSAWAGVGKNSYKYDGNNNLIEFISLDSGGGNAYKYSYQYDASNNKTEVLYQNWEGSAWVNYDRFTYTFDVNNNLTEEIYQQWIASAWLNRYMYSYTYVSVTVIEEDFSSLNSYNLSQNFPNPFNPSTVISWQSLESGWQTLKIYDVLGKEVATLVDEYKPAGKYEIEFNASNFASGIYLYKLHTENFVEMKKMVLMK